MLNFFKIKLIYKTKPVVAEFLAEISNLSKNEFPSPDRSGNPFVAGFATKDWNG
jgi:hypothetical protein